jgi:hypothetical protein
MKELTHPSPSVVAAVVEDLQRIARRLMTISEDGVARGMTHTNGVDCLIGLVDRMDYACALVETKSGGQAEPAETAGDPTVGELPDLCQDVRCKAADLDRLNRDGVGVASEIGELAAELMRIEGELRRGLASASEPPTA